MTVLLNFYLIVIRVWWIVHYPFKNDKNKIAKLLGIEADFEVEEEDNFRGDENKNFYRLSNLKFTNSGAKIYLKMTEADGQAYALTDFYKIVLPN